jgi:hypothetical protein
MIIATNATISTQNIPFFVLFKAQNVENKTIIADGCHNDDSKYSPMAAQPIPSTAPR